MSDAFVVPGPRVVEVGGHAGRVAARHRDPAMSVMRLDEIAWHAGGVAGRASASASRRPSGEFIALMGRNGAGKSTVLDVMAGMRVPSAGTVMLDGRPFDAWTRDRARTPRRSSSADRARGAALHGRTSWC